MTEPTNKVNDVNTESKVVAAPSLATKHAIMLMHHQVPKELSGAITFDELAAAFGTIDVSKYAIRTREGYALSVEEMGKALRGRYASLYHAAPKPIAGQDYAQALDDWLQNSGCTATLPVPVGRQLGE